MNDIEAAIAAEIERINNRFDNAIEMLRGGENLIQLAKIAKTLKLPKETLEALEEYTPKIEAYLARSIKNIEALKLPSYEENPAAYQEKTEALKKVPDKLDKVNMIMGDITTLLTALTTIIKANSKNTPEMPVSTLINTIGNVLKAGNEIYELPKQHKKINHGSKLSVKNDGLVSGKEGKTLVQIDLNASKGYLKIRIPNDIIDNMRGYSITTKKIMLFLFQKINEQIFHDGVLTRDYIQFPAHELIDNGLYLTRQSGRTGFKAAMEILTNFEVAGELHYKGGKTIKVNQLAVLFPTVEYGIRGQYKIYVNQQINWNLLFQAFSILPDYYYEIQDRASELLYYIFYLARQNTENIKKRGYFTISFKAIQKQLYLPDERQTKNPRRDILDPIHEAINQIEKKQREKYGTEDLLFLSPEYNEKAPIAEILNEGYLEVHLDGRFAKLFIKIEDEKIKALKEAQKHAQGRRRKALPPKTE